MKFTRLETFSERNLGYIIDDIPEEFHPLLEKYSNNTYELDADLRDGLAGHLSASYDIPIKDNNEAASFKEYIFNLAYMLDGQLDDNTEELRFLRFWINYQKKYDFNPMHFHSGDYSFVIWWKIPYSIEEENSVFPKVEHKYNGYFSFYYIKNGGVVTSDLPVDKTWEKKICIFPANLLHGVNPFYTSDEYRITFSGNLKDKE